MTKILFSLLMVLSFIGCSSKGEELQNVKAKLVVGQSLTNVKLSDQFEKEHAINPNTTKIIFAFSKDVAHTCNDFFKTQTPEYLAQNNTQFIADVSAAPSLIRSMFIMPGLKDFKHTVLILDDKALAAPYRKGIDTEKILVVYVNNGAIVRMKSINSSKELQETIEAK